MKQLGTAFVLSLVLTPLGWQPVVAFATSPPTYQPRIQGGGPATSAWPAIGSLEQRLGGFDSSDTSHSHECGGVLVSARWFLTAAHCISVGQLQPLPSSEFRISLGKSDLNAGPLDFYTLDSVVKRHPSYTASSSSEFAKYDLALLHLSRPAVQDPLRIVSPSESALWKSGTSAVLAGWGKTCLDDSAACGPVRQLREVTIPIINDAECRRLEGEPFDPAIMLCAGEGEKGGCEGDSGSPLMVRRLGEPVVVGVNTGGFYPCTTPQHPSIFTRLSAPGVNVWIRELIPTVAFSAAPSVPRPGETVQLTATSTKPTSQPGAPVYSWDIDNDGMFDDHTGPLVSLPFARAGTYPVRVQSVYPDGDRAVAREVVTVAGPSGGSGSTVFLLPRLIAAPRRARVRSLLGRRMSVRIQCFSPCSVKASLRLRPRTQRADAVNSGTILGSGRVSTTRAATVRVTIKLTRRAVRRLRRVRRGNLALHATVTETNRQTPLDHRIRLRP